MRLDNDHLHYEVVCSAPAAVGGGGCSGGVCAGSSVGEARVLSEALFEDEMIDGRARRQCAHRLHAMHARGDNEATVYSSAWPLCGRLPPTVCRQEVPAQCLAP